LFIELSGKLFPYKYNYYNNLLFNLSFYYIDILLLLYDDNDYYYYL